MTKKQEKSSGHLIEIIKKALVTYKDGHVALFDAIYIENNIVIIGRISKNNIFLQCGGIPKANIKNINGNSKKVLIIKEG